jgi:hypothetical protein
MVFLTTDPSFPRHTLPFVGIHGESSTFFVLLFLYFWDIIFMDDIPDVFYNKYQMAPLDMRSEEFYLNRKRPINKRLKWLKNASEEVRCSDISYTGKTLHYKSDIKLLQILYRIPLKI